MGLSQEKTIHHNDNYLSLHFSADTNFDILSFFYLKNFFIWLVNRDHIEPRFRITDAEDGERIFANSVFISLWRETSAHSCIVIRFLILFGTRTSKGFSGFILKSPIINISEISLVSHIGLYHHCSCRQYDSLQNHPIPIVHILLRHLWSNGKLSANKTTTILA